MWTLTEKSILVFAILNISYCILGVRSLNLTQLIVPLLADRGSTVNLTCKFDLGDGRLYSIKWYKDEFEFFRYMPDWKPQTTVYIVPGVTLNWTCSGMNTVVLKDLTFNSSGTYSCEVSTEAPAYLTDVRKAKMTVIALPKKDPVLDGVKPSYEDGEYVMVNCTSAPSNPAPELDWYINGNKANHWLVVHSPVVYNANDDTYTRSTLLTVQAQKSLFVGANLSLEIKCVSVIAGLPVPPRERIARLRLAGTLNNQKLAQERHGTSRGETRMYGAHVVVTVCATISVILS